MLTGRVDPTGALYIVMSGLPAPAFHLEGCLQGYLGGLFCTTSAPTRFLDGFGMTDDGKVCIAPGGTVHRYNKGLPMTADGRLVTQLNQPESPGDVYVDGIRVGPLGGVYTIDATPAPEKAYSSAFDGGFD